MASPLSTDPQITSFIAGYPQETQLLIHELRLLVYQTVPGVIEALIPGWQLIGYRVPHGKRSRYFGHISPVAKGVRLGFEYGILLSNHQDLEGNGTQVRYITLQPGQAINVPMVAPLISEAAMLAVSR